MYHDFCTVHVFFRELLLISLLVSGQDQSTSMWHSIVWWIQCVCTHYQLSVDRTLLIQLFWRRTFSLQPSVCSCKMALRVGLCPIPLLLWCSAYTLGVTCLSFKAGAQWSSVSESSLLLPLFFPLALVWNALRGNSLNPEILLLLFNLVFHGGL